MNQLFRFGVILGTICLTATLVLALTYEITRPAIERQLSGEEQGALRVILPEADFFYKRLQEGLEYFEGSKGGKGVGYCIKTTGNGYGGVMRIIVGIDMDGVIKGVRILEHHETPGLGSKINEIKAGEDAPWFLRQFINRPTGAIELKKDIDAVTGATISSKAVTEAVGKSVSEFLRHR